ncbi:unannotated protein [freshwater metagenome]|uniref:Unannotated protein n=1 Tax=freshwater metagenome TaxID=449393 RepID=A0A6J6ZT69_9ZZZZ
MWSTALTSGYYPAPSMTLPFLSAPRWTRLAAVAFVAVLAPLCFLGPGTDLDTGAVLHAGDRIVHGAYEASRAPGAPVHEAVTGVLDWALGGWAVNLASLAGALVLCGALWLLLDREGVARPWLAVAFVAASPWFQIASTSTVDFVGAAALLVCGALAVRRNHPVVAGVLCGLSVGMRMSGVLIVVAIVAAEATGRDAHRDRALRVLVVGGIVGMLSFLAPFLAAHGSMAFAQNDFSTTTPLSHLGRAFAKNVAYVGPVGFVLVLFAVPALWRLRLVWSDRWTVRFASIGFVLSEALFLRFPWKLGHLVPAAICLSILLAEALRDRRVLLGAIVVAQLALGAVNVEFLRPDVPNLAQRAEPTLRVGFGPLVIDTRCRLDDKDAARSGDIGRLETVWNCARPWGNGR